MAETTCSNCGRKFTGSKCPYCGTVVGGGEDLSYFRKGKSEETEGGTGDN